jgi:catechol 2,3-dioxygenase-like lactoylglutathione lyase family enzyme
MPDVGFTHVALPVTNLDASIDFYFKYARLQVVHRRPQSTPGLEVAWLSDMARPFVLVLAEFPQVQNPLGPFAHLGVACATREEVDRLCELAKSEGCLRDEPYDSGGVAGYYGNLNDPDGHTLELSYAQEVGVTLERAAVPTDRTQ